MALKRCLNIGAGLKAKDSNSSEEWINLDRVKARIAA